MKKLALIIVSLSFSWVFAQSYLPMLEAGNAWGTIYYPPVNPGDPPVEIFEQYNISGDFNLGGKTYTRVFKDFQPTDCYIREEAGKVYLFKPVGEVLLMDFTLEVGETMVVPDAGCFRIDTLGDTLFFANSVTQETIAGEDRKVIEVSTSGGGGGFIESWIEGIGATSGGIHPGGFGLESGVGLSCFYSGGEVIYTTGGDCELGVDDNKLDQIFLVPNPVSEIATLQYPVQLIIDQVLIYDLQGKLLDQIPVEGTIIFNTSNYNNGVYFYQAISGNSVVKTEKFLVK